MPEHIYPNEKMHFADRIMILDCILPTAKVQVQQMINIQHGGDGDLN
jgi:hypothetical protein